MELVENLDPNSIVLVGGAILVVMAVLAAKHKRGMAAAGSFAMLLVVIGLKYYRHERCADDEVLLWRFCVPESQVSQPY